MALTSPRTPRGTAMPLEAPTMTTTTAPKTQTQPDATTAPIPSPVVPVKAATGSPKVVPVVMTGPDRKNVYGAHEKAVLRFAAINTKGALDTAARGWNRTAATQRFDAALIAHTAVALNISGAAYASIIGTSKNTVGNLVSLGRLAAVHGVTGADWEEIAAAITYTNVRAAIREMIATDAAKFDRAALLRKAAMRKRTSTPKVPDGSKPAKDDAADNADTVNVAPGQSVADGQNAATVARTIAKMIDGLVSRVGELTDRDIALVIDAGTRLIVATETVAAAA